MTVVPSKTSPHTRSPPTAVIYLSVWHPPAIHTCRFTRHSEKKTELTYVTHMHQNATTERGMRRMSSSRSRRKKRRSRRSEGRGGGGGTPGIKTGWGKKRARGGRGGGGEREREGGGRL